MKVLYESASIRTEVQQLFESGTKRRVAIVAFVGKEAHAYLVRPKGIELYCWDAPGTNPEVIDQLQHDWKVKCFFGKDVHMKVYYAQGVGCVIASANLSIYALAGGKLKEAGVLLPDGAVDIDRLLRQFTARPVTPELLDKLRSKISTAKRKFGGTGKQGRSFEDWFNCPVRERPQWLFAPYTQTRTNSSNQAVRARAKSRFHMDDCIEMIECGAETKENSRLLTALVGPGRTAKQWAWMFVDEKLPYSAAERNAKGANGHSHQAVQWLSHAAREQPFRHDAAFQKAFRIALNTLTPRQQTKLLDHTVAEPLPDSFLAAISKASRRSPFSKAPGSGKKRKVSIKQRT